MTDNADRTSPSQPGADAHQPPASRIPAASRWLLPVSLLRPHPGNPRHDLALSPEFLASLQHDGILVPLRIVPDGDGGYWVIDGNRRLAGAAKAGLAEVPCDLASDRDGDTASQHLDMVTTSRHRVALKPVEEARALFAASRSGATRTRLRQATGMTAPELRTALAAGGLSDTSRAAVAAAGRALTLEQCALLAEFDDDPDAVARLMEAAGRGYGMEYEAARIRRERADRARREQAAADLAAAGVTVTDDLPEGAVWLTDLTHDGVDLAAEPHADCPGHAAVLSPFDPEPLWYCAAPAAHGHLPRTRPSQAEGGTRPGPARQRESMSSTGTGRGRPAPTSATRGCGTVSWAAGPPRPR
jgi:ParB family chromosome partitioning protein